MKKLLLTLLILLIIVSGCNTNEPPPPIPPEDYEPLIPLKHGNYWLYEQYYYLDSLGNGGKKDTLFGDFGFIIDSTYSYILKNKEITAYRMFRCGEKLEPYNWGFDFYGSKLLYNDKNGVHYSGIEKHDTLKMAFDDLIFSAKAEKGDTLYGHLFYYWTMNNEPNLPKNYTPPYYVYQQIQYLQHHLVILIAGFIELILGT